MAQSNISPIISIGNLLGEKNAKRAGVTSDTSIVIAFIIGCIWRYVPSCANENGDGFRKRILITFFEIVRCISCSGIRGDIYLIMTQVGYVFFFSLFYFEIKLKYGRTEVVKLVASILPILGLFQVFEGWNTVTASILRAKGKQVRYTDRLEEKRLRLLLVLGCHVKPKVKTLLSSSTFLSLTFVYPTAHITCSAFL